MSRKTLPTLFVSILILLLTLLGLSGSLAQDPPAESPAPPTDIPTESSPAEPTLEPTALPPAEVPTDIPPPTATDLVPTDAPTAELTAEVPVTVEVTVGPEPSPVPPEETVPPALLPEPPMRLLVREMFDNADLSPWLLAPGWSLAGSDSGLGLLAQNTTGPARLLKGAFSNLAVQARFASTGGLILFSLRQSAIGNDTVAIDPAGMVVLYRAGAPVQGVGILPLLPGTWHTLRMSAVGDVLRVALDEVEIITVADPAPLPPGEVSIAASYSPTAADGSPVSNTLAIDDFFLWVPVAEAGNYPPPTPVAPPVLPTEAPPVIEILPTAIAPTEVPTEAPLVELPTDVITVEPTEELVIEPTAEITAEPTAEPTVEVTAEITAEPTVEPTSEATAEPTELPVSEPVGVIGKDLGAAAPPTLQQRADAQAAGSDNFAARVSISSVYPGNTANGDTTLATLEANETKPTCGLNIANTVWYTFTPPATASYTVSLAGSTFDTVLGIYTGTDVTTLTRIACNDDANAAVLTSSVTASLTGGTAYAIQIGGYNGRFGLYIINVQKVGVPVPAAPLLTGPTNGAITADLTPPLSWNPALNTATYDLQIATATTFVSPIAINDLGATTFSPVSDLAPGTYFWRVRGRNTNGIAGAFSAARTFVVKTSGPVLSLPLNNSTLTTVRPQLRWLSWGAGATYTIELNDSSDFSGGADFTFTTTALAYTLTTNLNQGTWYWRVRAENLALPTAGAFSDPFSFTIFVGTAPANGVFSPDTTPTFSWAAIPGVTVYLFELDDDTDFTGDWVIFMPVAGLTTITLSPAQTLPTGMYYWRVVPNGGTTISNVYRTLYIGTAPPAPTLVSPANASFTNDTTPDLTWNAVTPPAGVVVSHYEIELARNAAMTVGRISDVPVAPPFSAPTLTDGLWCWRVRAVFPPGFKGPFSPVRCFTVDTTPLAPPVLNPLSWYTPSVRPTFTWKPVVGAVRYQFDLYYQVFSQVFVYDNRSVTGTTFAIPLSDSPLNQGYYSWRVRAVDAAGNVSGNSSTGYFNMFIGTAPIYGAFTTDTTPTFVWAAVPAATGYILQIDDDQVFDTGEINYIYPLGVVTTYTLTPAQALTNGTWYWRVIPDFSGTPGGINGVVIRPLHIGAAPPAPVLVSPINGAITNDSTPALTWNAVVPPPGVALNRYKVDIATNATFTTGVQSSLPAGTTHTFPALADGLYYWRVAAEFVPGTLGPYSLTRSFRVDTGAPPPPNLNLPANGAIVPAARPTFTWGAVAGAVGYRLDVDNNADFSSPLPNLNNRTVTGVSLVFPLAEPPLDQGLYYWRMRAVDAAGNVGASTNPARTFTVFIGSAPANGAFTVDTTPTFTWAAVGGATGYTLEIDDDTDFSADLVRSKAVGPVATTTLTVAEALTPGTYYWRVIPNGGTTVSNVYRTLFIGAAPPAPTLVSPVNAFFTRDNAPDLTWNPVTPPAGVLLGNYEVQIAKNSAFTIGLLTGTPAGTPFTTPTLTDGLWYWRVRAVFAPGILGPFSLARAFTVDTIAPAVPALLSPANNATVITLQPAFRWSAPVGAVRYDLQIGTTNPPTTVYPNLLAPAFTPPSPLIATSYFWQVRAYDRAGNVSAYSGIWTVKVATASSAAPMLNRFTATVRLTWSPISWTSPGGYYQLEMDDHATFASPLYRSADHGNVLPTGTLEAVEGVTTGFPALSNGTWYWRVRACLAAGTCGSWSTSGSFVVER